MISAAPCFHPKIILLEYGKPGGPHRFRLILDFNADEHNDPDADAEGVSLPNWTNRSGMTISTFWPACGSPPQGLFTKNGIHHAIRGQGSQNQDDLPDYCVQGNLQALLEEYFYCMEGVDAAMKRFAARLCIPSRTKMPETGRISRPRT